MDMIAQRRYQCKVMVQLSLNVYSFRFNTCPERIPAAVTGGIQHGVTHEIPFVLGNLTNLTTDTYEILLGTDPELLAVSESIMGTLISFVNHLNPNHVFSGLSYWPSYGESAVIETFVFDINHGKFWGSR
ncbi:hypothetical protein BDZ89DRAFT_731025 [Hymenopellis radicata]|nr:hypothetical protein BDZ89DRAFT_731025 [Hymenopellis radicata]